MTTPESPLMRLLRFLGKVQFTTVLLLGGAVIMTIGTIFESRESRDAAWSAIYGTVWFDVFLFLIAVNLVIAVVNRIPIQRHQWPFVVTHFAIVILLAGAWISRSFGYEGRMLIFEGEAASELQLDAPEIRTRWTGPAGESFDAAFPLERGADAVDRTLRAYGENGPWMRVADHIASGLTIPSLGYGGPGDSPGIEFRITGPGFRADEWLIVGDPEFRHKDLGPVEVAFYAAGRDAEGRLRFPGEYRANIQLSVLPRAGGRPVRLPLPASVGVETPCGPGLTAVVEQFALRSQVVAGRVVETASGAINPAVVVRINSGGASEIHTVFANHPDFGTIEGRSSDGPLVASVALDTSALSEKPVIAILSDPDGRVHAQVVSATGAGTAIPVALGTPVEFASLGFFLEARRLLPQARVEMAVQPSAPGREGARQFLRIEAGFEGKRASFWLARGSSRTWALSGGRGFEVTFSSQTRSVPFVVALEEFELIPHPGSTRAAEYRSHVRVNAGGREPMEKAAVVSMNRPLDVAGFRLFQSSYQLGREGGPDATVFSVSYDPGVPIVYSAFLLLVVGIAWGLRPPRHRTAQAVRFEKPAWVRTASGPGEILARTRVRLSGVDLQRTVVVAALLVFVLSVASAVRAQPTDPSADLPLEETAGWVILADGRAKPLLTYATETALSVTGRTDIDGLSPLELLWGYALAAEDFRSRPYIRVDSLALKAKLGLHVDQRRFSFDSLTENSGFREIVERATKRKQDGVELDRLEDDALATYAKLDRIAGLLSSEALKIIPNGAGDGRWSTPSGIDRSESPSKQALHAGFARLALAYRSGDADAFGREARELTIALRGTGDALYPTASQIDRELFYGEFNAFGKAWKLYLAGALAIAILGFTRSPLGYRTGLVLVAAGFVCHSVGIGTRWAIAGRAPVSDMYESLIFMGWGAIALGLGFEIWQRKRVLAASAGVLGFVCLAFAENLPIDSAVNPLVPVLANTSWLAIHVMTIMLSYSALGLAMILGHVLLCTEVFRRDDYALSSSLAKILYKTIQVGVLLLAAGIVFGAVWANESWGRYWGWDPKETWSLITFFIYLAIIHARFAGWLHSFGLAASSVLAFLAVIMTYYGVNFILSTGMHAYGFADGGQLYVTAYAITEIAIIIAAYLLRAAATGQAGPMHSDTGKQERLST